MATPRLVTGLRALFLVLGFTMVATLIYTISTDGLPFRRELLTPYSPPPSTLSPPLSLSVSRGYFMIVLLLVGNKNGSFSFNGPTTYQVCCSFSGSSFVLGDHYNIYVVAACSPSLMMSWFLFRKLIRVLQLILFRTLFVAAGWQQLWSTSTPSCSL